MKVTVKLNKRRIMNRYSGSIRETQYRLDSQVQKDSNFYAPRYRGDLQDSSVIHSRLGSGEVVWRTPYARRLYYNPQYNFSKDKNANARGLWFEAAKSFRGRSWIALAQSVFRRNF